jgi:hypothetical protein
MSPVGRVVVNAPEAEIWNAMFELFEHTSPRLTTPPIAIFGMLLRSSSASQRGIGQTHDEVGRRFLEELTGHIYYDVEGFER